jgi:lysophospholipase L1-like esterase
MIHFIGDSHSSIFSGNYDMQPIWPEKSNNVLPNFKSYRIGPATSYKLSEKEFIISTILNNEVIKDNDYVFFCFGEIDCRAHLIKQSELQNKNISDIVKDCVEKYFEFIKKYHSIGYKIGVWGPIASWSEKKPYTTGPSFGTTKERNIVTKLYNETLEELCIENNILFTTMFYDMIDENLDTNENYLDDWDGCHIHLNSNSIPVILEKFKNLSLI